MSPDPKLHLTEGEEQALDDALREGRDWVARQMYNMTQCPHGCEALAECTHGYKSLRVRAGLD